ncbi:hypothetical protein BJ742DRAFT_842494 [Cladochytrium replicatum]|nr:hypothetical protein BJ742DRAFT_842494 [Cladochytrium replicatum]
MATLTSTITTVASRTTTAPPAPTTTRTTTATTTTANQATLTQTSAAGITSRATTAASTTRGTASSTATSVKTTHSSTSTPTSAALANSAPSTIAGISTTLFIAGAVVVGLVVLAVVGLVIFARTGRSAKQKRIAAAKKAAKEYTPPDSTSQWPSSNKISMGSAPNYSLNRSVYNGNDYNNSMPRGYTRASTATSVSSHSSGAALYQNAAPPGFGYVVVQSAPPPMPNQMYASQPYPLSVTPIPPPSQYASAAPYYALPPNQFPAQPPVQQGYAMSDYGRGGDDLDERGTRYGSNERRYAPRGDSRY